MDPLLGIIEKVLTWGLPGASVLTCIVLWRRMNQERDEWKKTYSEWQSKLESIYDEWRGACVMCRAQTDARIDAETAKYEKLLTRLIEQSEKAGTE